MYKLLFLIFPLFVLNVHSEETEPAAASQKKPEFTQEQLDKLHAAEEQYKDNPEMMDFINKVKDASGLNDKEEEQQTAETKPVTPQIQGSKTVAEEAYRKGDYQTALEHYQALAAKGDADASLKLGTMYQQGQGTEKDAAKAHAYYKAAADGGDDRGNELMKLVEKTDMTSEDTSKSDQYYEEIKNKSKVTSETVSGAVRKYPVSYEQKNPNVSSYGNDELIKLINNSHIIPEKTIINHPQLSKGSMSFIPTKIFRNN